MHRGVSTLLYRDGLLLRYGVVLKRAGHVQGGQVAARPRLQELERVGWEAAHVQEVEDNLQ